MKNQLFSKKNNIFQSSLWLNFQEKYGRTVIKIGDLSGLELGLPFGKSAVLVQKGPEIFSNDEFSTLNLSKKVVFVRVEPGEVSEKEIKKQGLKKVSKGSLFSGQASPKATRVLDISGTEEEILAQMKPKTRYNIRLAEKKGVTVRSDADTDVLYELLQKTAQRDKGYAPHEKDYYVSMLKELPAENIQVLVAEHEGDKLAAIVVCYFGELAIYLHGGFNDAKRNLMAPYLCQWTAIKEAKKRGCTVYDFWGVAETDDPKDSWAGITRFKEGFGGEKIIFPGTYDLVLDKFWYNLLTIAAKLKHLVR